MRRKQSYNYINNITDTLNSFEEEEKLERGTDVGEPTESNVTRTTIGEAKHHYSKLSCAAIKLTGALKVSDIMEIGSKDGAIRKRVTSMQMSMKDVGNAVAGQSIGVKVKYPVLEGSGVYMA